MNHENAFTFLLTVVIASVVTGVFGGLVSIWLDDVLGWKIVSSAVVVGAPTLIIFLFLSAAIEEEKSEDSCEKDGDKH